MKSRQVAHVIGIALTVALGGTWGAHAATRTASVSGYWTNAATWGADPIPADTDDAVIKTNVTVTLDLSPATLSSLTANGTLVFTNWMTVLTAQVVTVNGTIRHGVNSATATNLAGQWVPDARIYIVCSNLTVATNGGMNADGRGYQGAPVWGTNGYGPGRGYYSSGGVGGGGTYGGKGGSQTTKSPEYGSLTFPEDPGSGGGGGYSSGQTGGNGGGAIRIDAAGVVTIDGTVSASGNDYSSQQAGAGSGGSVWITCRTLQGSGATIRANGGNAGTPGGGGGGGRVAIAYNAGAQTAASQPSLTIQTLRGIGMNDPFGQEDAKLGTVSLPDTLVLPVQLLNWHGRFSGFSTWSPSSLTLSNGYMAFPSNVVLNVSNALIVVGSSARLDLFNASASCDRLIMTNSSALWLYAAPTNGVAPDYGALVIVRRDMVLDTNCWVYPVSHATNGGSVLFRVGSLAVATNGGFNANGWGFAREDVTNRTAGDENGYGPGGWLTEQQGSSGGAGYGGAGGDGSRLASHLPYVGNYGSATYGTNVYSWGYGGVTYGSSNAPIDPGSASGGGYQSAKGAGQGSGGGVIRIEGADSVVMNGLLTANGNDGGGNGHAGGGAGGGIYITTKRFSGSGVLQAKGGNVSGANYQIGGGGGGGRIAVWSWSGFNTFGGTMTATNGAGNSHLPGINGTVVVGATPVPNPGIFIQIR